MSAIDLGVLAAAALLRRGDLSSAELTDACLRRIEQRNGGPPTHDGTPEAINAWARLYPEMAREWARAAGVIRAASAAALPPLEPPATRSSAHGLPTWSVVPPAANSWVWVCPSSTIPRSRKRVQATASWSHTCSSSTRLEAVSGTPATA